MLKVKSNNLTGGRHNPKSAIRNPNRSEAEFTEGKSAIRNPQSAIPRLSSLFYLEVFKNSGLKLTETHAQLLVSSLLPPLSAIIDSVVRY